MPQDAAGAEARRVGETRVAGLVVHLRFAVLPQRNVHVHAAPVVPENRLGHEVRDHPMLRRGVLHHVLVLLDVVGHLDERVEPHVNLTLPRAAHLVVVHFDVDAHVEHAQHHRRADVLQLVARRDGEVAALLTQRVARTLLVTRVPERLFGVDLEERSLGIGVVRQAVEEEELGLGPKVCGVSDAGRPQILLGLLRHEARIAGVALTGERILDVADHDRRWEIGEGVHEQRGWVGHEQHIALVDALEPTDARTIETQTVLEEVLAEVHRRNCEVVPHSEQVCEPDVDDLGFVLMDEGYGLFGIHGSPWLRCSRQLQGISRATEPFRLARVDKEKSTCGLLCPQAPFPILETQFASNLVHEYTHRSLKLTLGEG